MNITVRLMSAMATARSAELSFPGQATTVSRVLEQLLVTHPDLNRWVYSGPGTLRPGVNVFLGEENVRFLEGLDTVVPAGSEVWIVTPESGG